MPLRLQVAYGQEGRCGPAVLLALSPDTCPLPSKALMVSVCSTGLLASLPNGLSGLLVCSEPTTPSCHPAPQSPLCLPWFAGLSVCLQCPETVLGVVGLCLSCLNSDLIRRAVCETLDKFLVLSLPQFLPLLNRDAPAPLPWGRCQDTEAVHLPGFVSCDGGSSGQQWVRRGGLLIWMVLSFWGCLFLFYWLLL